MWTVARKAPNIPQQNGDGTRKLFGREKCQVRRGGRGKPVLWEIHGYGVTVALFDWWVMDGVQSRQAEHCRGVRDRDSEQPTLVSKGETHDSMWSSWPPPPPPSEHGKKEKERKSCGCACLFFLLFCFAWKHGKNGETDPVRVEAKCWSHLKSLNLALLWRVHVM